MKNRPLIYDPRIKQNIPLTQNPNPALILLDLILRSPCSLRSSTLEEIIEQCGKLANFCDERTKVEDNGR